MSIRGNSSLNMNFAQFIISHNFFGNQNDRADFIYGLILKILPSANSARAGKLVDIPIISHVTFR